MTLQGIPKSKSGLPILSDAQIDGIAEECARDFFPEMFELPQPVDPAEFIEFVLGFDLDYLYLSNCQLYLGMTCFKSIAIPTFDRKNFRARKTSVAAGTVVIDRGLYEDALSTGHEGRLRFTEAHEAGHCIFHGNFFLNAAGQSRESENTFLAGTRSVYATEADFAEHQADMFASCFLIPLGSLRKLMDLHNAWRWEDRDILILVKDTYNVSWPTAFYRLQKLGWLATQSTVFNWDEFSGY